MTELIRAWAPTLKGNDEPTMSLAVPVFGEASPDGESYANLLEARLQALIEANPIRALRDLKEVSTPEYPGLYPELKWHPPHHWIVHIMLSIQMRTLLNRIDWKQSGPVQRIAVEDLPNFIDILQMMN